MIDRSDSLNLAFKAENSRYSAETETGRSGGSFDGFYEHGSLAPDHPHPLAATAL
jgi:hypothetical protein